MIPVRLFLQTRTHMRQCAELEKVFRSHGWDYGYAARWYDGGVSINDSRFGDDELLLIKESLEKHTAAAFLSFRGTKVSEEGIKAIDFSGFRRRGFVINVSDTQVSNKGAQELQQSLPDCRIIHEALR